jgi:two-component sensor histidine kinase
MMRIMISTPVFTLIFALVIGIHPALSEPASGSVHAVTQNNSGKLPSKAIVEVNALNGLSEKYMDSLQEISFDLATQALRLAKLINYRKGEAAAYYNLGFHFLRQKIYLNALGSFMESLNIAKQDQYEVVVCEDYNGMGLLFMDLGRRDRAIEYLRKGLAYAKKNNSEDLIGIYIRLGQLMNEQGDTNEAFRLYFNALALRHKLARVVSRVWVMKSIGNLYLSRKRYDIALFYYLAGIKENLRDSGNINGTINSIIAHTYEEENDLDNSLRYNKIAFGIRKIENQPSLLTSSMINMGHIYLKLGKYDSSLFYLEKGLKNANLLNLNSLKEAGYKNLYELYMAKRDWKNALDALQAYNSAKNSVENEKNKDQVSLMENNRIISEKEKLTEGLRDENAIQKLEAKNRDLLLLLLITLILLTIALAVYIQQLLIKNKKAKKIVEERNDQLQDEIKEQEEAFLETVKQTEILISEVHHRVKNNLATLSSLVNLQKSEFTDLKTLDLFADLQFRVRAMALVHEQLYKSRNIEVLPIAEYLSKLVAIVSSAYSTIRIEIHQDFYEEIVDVGLTLPLGLIVNELMTNAFKYAFPGNREGNIWVSYKKAPPRNNSEVEMRCLTVRDDGIGLPPGFELSQRTSMGSQIIHLLTQQLEGEITIDGSKGASFSILLPLEI